MCLVGFVGRRVSALASGALFSRGCLPDAGSPGLCSNPVHRVNDAIRPPCPMSSPVLSSSFPSIRAYSSESTLHIRWPKYWPGGSVVKNGPAGQETRI